MHMISFFYHLIYYGTLAKSSLLVEFQGSFCRKSSFVPAVPIMQEPNRTLLIDFSLKVVQTFLGENIANEK